MVILLFLHYTGPRSFNMAQVKPAKLPSISELLSYQPPQPPSVADSTHQVHLCTLISHFNARILMFTEVISPRDHRSGLFDDANERRLTAYSIAGLSSKNFALNWKVTQI
jgi:hypothetical protein